MDAISASSIQYRIATSAPLPPKVLLKGCCHLTGMQATFNTVSDLNSRQAIYL
jgi:hypothetical protein